VRIGGSTGQGRYGIWMALTSRVFGHPGRGRRRYIPENHIERIPHWSMGNRENLNKVVVEL
jgi:hypothetical protein